MRTLDIRLLTVPEAAKLLSLQPSTIRRAIFERRMEYVRVGRRAVRIPYTEIDRILLEGLRPRIPEGQNDLKIFPDLDKSKGGING